MFETLQFLIRIQKALGEDSVVSIGKGALDVVVLSVTWKGREEEFLAQMAIVPSIITSAISDDMMEEMIIQRLTNEHKMWEVGEI